MDNAARWRHKAAYFLNFKSIFLHFPKSEKNSEKYFENIQNRVSVFERSRERRRTSVRRVESDVSNILKTI